jgi:hypothetical protein
MIDLALCSPEGCTEVVMLVGIDLDTMVQNILEPRRRSAHALAVKCWKWRRCGSLTRGGRRWMRNDHQDHVLHLRRRRYCHGV